MILLDSSKSKEDKLYRAALKLFHFPGVSGINLGVSETGIDAGFGSVLSKQVINDAFDIVKSGSEQPEIFQLVGLFEKNVSADRLSDMIATIILPDIRNYTIGINRKLNINILILNFKGKLQLIHIKNVNFFIYQKRFCMRFQ